MNNFNSVLQDVWNSVIEHRMIEKGDNVLAAVSGGADSVCMLHILNDIGKLMGFSLCCAHLNHQLRGEEADRDQKFVVELCEKLGIKVFTKSVDVALLARQKKISTEEAGRLARYEFFGELSKEYKVDKIATAHNKNDNAETVLMRILRGTGIDGLKGISRVREDGVIRPLLDVSRMEIEAYCRENGIKFCTDSTNAENDYTRNKIRNQLIPYLEENFNCKVIDSLERLSENAKGDAEFLDGYAKRLYVRLRNPLPNHRPVSLHIESLGMVEKAVSSRVIRIAADEAVKGVRLEKKHLDDVFELMLKQTGAEINLPDGLSVSVNYGWLTFQNQNEVAAEETNQEGFFASVSPGGTVFVKALGKNVSFKVEDAKKYKCKVNELAVSYDLLEGQQLFLRSRKSGDRIVWFPDGRTKKIKNILIDEKIPQKERERIPLLCTDSEVIAIVGCRASGKYKITDETERALVIEYGTNEKS